ncbi:hypothetical protein AR457_26370 [Streptomyces agglomeratus]|uniref:DUF4352 domain-containing protein n=1 Tax=Streptomyces agglomeratus TaxID=285458 RepID=A0A1E5PD61_9ACTN|nr:DUF4352 domain-containing protein [Streptomyces agglomeratus]OEJ27463.1 hypothetical protein AS594_26245 [Streptomyces agglomeratus]OEJ42265.1 hypothetical protein BGK70_10285 [Streptomyces agglomeratus]OEJ47135.1 hypothetical protein AR457_26370 [Streptomyces agglomeratus]OEJ51008.1 hypothetical protein BGK72_09770 [Streptomyces agglomeratus]OEJ58378.1 hypothetical protein BGM19_10680 [Streptomyces agglomeratus]
MAEKNQGKWGRCHTYLIAPIAAIALITMPAVSSSGAEGNVSGVQALTATTLCDERPENPKQKAQEPGIGDPVRDGKFEFTVTKVIPGVEEVGDEFDKKAQGQFVLVCMDVENIGDEAQLFDGSAQKLFDAEDREFSADTTAAVYLDESQSFLNEINPGNKVKGIVVFDVPKNVKPVKIELHDSFFSGGVAVNLNPS